MPRRESPTFTKKKRVKPVSTKRPVGRPSKTDPNDPNSIALKIQEQVNTFGAKCADNLATLFDAMYTVATKETKGASPTNKLSAAKYCIEFAKDYLEAVSGEDEGEEEDEPGIGNKSKVVTPLLSLASKD